MRTILICTLAVLAGCATAGEKPSLGEINLRQYKYGTIAADKHTYSVFAGRILSPDLDVSIDADGCMKGSYGVNLFRVCRDPEPAAAERSERPGASHVEHWRGQSGDFWVELENNGKELRADGYLSVSLGRAGTPVHATMPFGSGPQWDELRKNPALLAIAGAQSRVRGQPDAANRP
jgi:hypothetical protein